MAKTFHYFGWTFPNSHEKVLSIITSWQLQKLNRESPVDKQSFLYEPVKVVKARIRQGEDCLEIQWALKGGEQDSDMDDGSLCTIENKDRFNKAYPDITEKFYNSLKKPEKKSKPKLKAFKQVEGNTKLPDFFAVGKNTSDNENPQENVSANENEKRALESVSDGREPHTKKHHLSS